VEAVFSVLLVGVTFTAALSTVGACRLQRVRAEERIRGRMLAGDLLAEALAQAYAEPSRPLGALGRESEEEWDERDEWDDVDDYYNLVESPPRDREGSDVPGTYGWTRSARVEWVDPFPPHSVSPFETGAKRITVTVRRSNLRIAEAVGIRTNAPR
jgi:hypothetical protein